VAQVSEEDMPPPDNPLDTEIGVAVEFDAEEDEEEENERDVVVDEDEGNEDEEGMPRFVHWVVALS
jgi:hypothetical protein